MPDLTARFGLSKPRGGSSGSTPADIVDIDVLNGNADILDSYLGAPSCLSTARPNVVADGQLAYETDTKNLIIVTSGQWGYVNPYLPWSALPLLSSGYSAVAGTAYSIAGFEGKARGQVNRGTGNVTVGDRLFTLPAGQRPANSMSAQTRTAGTSVVYLAINATSGDVTVDAISGTTTYVGLDFMQWPVN